VTRCSLGLAFALFASLTVALPDVQAQTRPGVEVSEFPVFKDPEHRFSLQYPPTWVPAPPTAERCFMATYGRLGDPFAPEFNVLSLGCKPHDPGGPSAAELARILEQPDNLESFLDAAREYGGGSVEIGVEYVSHSLVRIGGFPAVRLLTRLSIPLSGTSPAILHSAQYIADAPARAGRYVLHCSTTAPDPGRVFCDALAATLVLGSGAAPALLIPQAPPADEGPAVVWSRWTVVRGTNPNTGAREVSIRTGSDRLGLAFVCEGGGPSPILLHRPLRGDADGKVEFTYRFGSGADEGPYRSSLLSDLRRSSPFAIGEGGPFMRGIGQARTATLTIVDPSSAERLTAVLNVRGLSQALSRMPCQ
jgi:hypothetical protein